jgi:ribose transport system substrate-binding protein
MKKYVLLLTALLIAIGTMCFTASKKDSSTSSSLKPSSRFYAMNVVVSGVPFWTECRNTLELISKSNGEIRTSFGGPLDTAADKQIAEVEALIAKSVDGIIIAPCDSAALRPTIDRAVSRGIPVITLLIDSPGSERLTYITSPLEASAEAIGELGLQVGGVEGSAIICFAQAGNEEQEGRMKGFKNLIARNPGLKLIDVIEDKYDERIGAERLKPLLIKYPDLKYIFGCNSRSSIGAVIALRELHYTQGKVFVSGWDHDEDVLNLVKEGWVFGTVAQQSSFMTIVAFSILQAYHDGYLYPASLSLAGNKVKPLPDRIEIPVQIVTKTNVNAFYRTKR